MQDQSQGAADKELQEKLAELDKLVSKRDEQADQKLAQAELNAANRVAAFKNSSRKMQESINDKKKGECGYFSFFTDCFGGNSEDDAENETLVSNQITHSTGNTFSH